MSNDLAPDEQYEYLEWRPSRWRKQFSIKGRKMTVGQFVSTRCLPRTGTWLKQRGNIGLPVGRRGGSGRLLSSGTRTSSSTEKLPRKPGWLIAKGVLPT